MKNFSKKDRIRIVIQNSMTPAMLQYKKIKSENPDCVVFFRMGDFYETFYDDAVTASKVLDITLTSRDRSTNNTPMAGIPYHALDAYLGKMINAGLKVCIVEQMEDPKKAKGIVKRDVVKIVTPGTASGDLIDQNKSNFLCSIYFPKPKSDINKDTKFEIGFSYIDTSTGEFKLTKFNNIKDLDNELYKLKPQEILTIESIAEVLLTSIYVNKNPHIVTILEDKFFKYAYAYKDLLSKLKVKSLRSFGIDENNKVSISSCGGIIEYVKRTQRTSLEHINSVSWYEPSEFMILDRSTINNLELVDPLNAKHNATLFNLLKRTETSMGARLLRRILLNPLRNPDLINERINIVDCFYKNFDITKNIKETLNEVCDIERISGKIGLGTINARDLVQLNNSIYAIKKIHSYLEGLKIKHLEKTIEEFARILSSLREIVLIIENTINPEAPLSIREGNLIKKGVNEEVDELRDAMTNGKDWIKKLEQEEIKSTGINTLKVRFNRVFGYYIEISKGSISKAPERYIRKQTLVNAERFITPELKEKEALVLGAEDRIKEIEYNLFIQIIDKIKPAIPNLQELAHITAEIDLYTNFAAIAREENYIKPVIDNGSEIIIKEGRHPVVEWINKTSSEQFITNDTYLENTNSQNANPLIILTGPNMGGKSTYIRQVALITLMAQIGSFVPASSAQIGCVDRIFTRVGASDNLAYGESTFMVEMIEAANILNSATENSLIILDEVGRGTSTYDGLSIAWAIVEYICKSIRAKTMFATHYHELTQLENEFSNIINFTVAVAENNGEIVFLRKIKKGKSEKSFGIHVAKLAGLPKDVIKIAERILKGLEQQSAKTKGFTTPQINIFDTPTEKIPEKNEVIEKLKSIDTNKITPIEALNEIYKLKEIIK